VGSSSLDDKWTFLLWMISELLLLWQDLGRLKDPSDANSALQETNKASTTSWMGWRLGQVVDHIHHFK
jgi:hypothetical protein